VSWLRSIGINTLGAWTQPGWKKRSDETLPYAELLNLLKSYASIKGEMGKKWPDVFSPRFDESVRKQVREKVKPLAGDPYLIGWWTDNELKWARGNAPLLDAYLEFPPGAPGRKAAEDYLRQTFGSASLPGGEEQRQSARDGFIEIAVRHYAEVTTRAIREHDPNHLILGSRLFFTPMPWKNVMPERMGGFEAVGRGARDYWDVVSVNAYFDDAPLDRLRKLHQAFGGPVLISEFNTAGATRDQGKRGEGEWAARTVIAVEGYSRQVPALLAEPFVVGYHYFPFTNLESPQKNNSAPGLTTSEGRRREPLADAFRAVNPRLESIHLAGEM